jgi:hypothetical protein
MLKKASEIALTLLGTGIALLTIVGSDAYIRPYVTLPPYAYAIAALTGWILLALSPTIPLMALLFLFGRWLGNKTRAKRLKMTYTQRYAMKADLPHIRRMLVKAFGEEHTPSLGLMEAWHDKHPQTFVCIYAVSKTFERTKEKLRATFKLIPLNILGVQAVEKGAATGTTLQAEHIAAREEEIAGYYIGDVVRSTFGSARPLIQSIEPLLCRGPFYARPLTRDGKLIMTAFRFFQVTNNEALPDIGMMCKRLPDAPPKARRSRRSRTAVANETSGKRLLRFAWLDA